MYLGKSIYASNSSALVFDQPHALEDYREIRVLG